MSNLLPETAQKRIWSGHRARFIFAGAILFIVAATLSALALVPSYMVLSATQPSMPEVAPVLAENNKSDIADIARAKTMVEQFTPLLNASSTASVAIEAAIAARPQGIRIDNMSYKSGKPSSLLIVGVADARDVINKYRENLRNDHRFASVALPVGDLIGTQGGRFTVTLTGEF